MFRIVSELSASDGAVLKLAGRLDGDHIDSLVQERQRYQNRRLTLDLNDLRDLDATGLTLLRAWVREGVALRGGSPFILLLLKRHSVL